MIFVIISTCHFESVISSIPATTITTSSVEVHGFINQLKLFTLTTKGSTPIETVNVIINAAKII